MEEAFVIFIGVFVGEVLARTFDRWMHKEK